MVHDFMVDAESASPRLAALWHMQHMAFTPEAASLTSKRIMAAMAAAGFVELTEAEVIPDMTRIVHARRPA